MGLRRHPQNGPDGVPWFKFYRTERLVTCYYFYIHDRRAGPAFIKVCAYAPYPVKVWCNGHEIARRAALAEGIAVTPLANGFAATSDPARLQELCDMIQAGTLRVFFEHWMNRRLLSAGVLPGMQARRFGRIINIGSEAGVATVPGLAAYCVSKHALVALTEVIQDGNHDNGIKAWVICPGSSARPWATSSPAPTRPTS